MPQSCWLSPHLKRKRESIWFTGMPKAFLVFLLVFVPLINVVASCSFKIYKPHLKLVVETNVLTRARLLWLRVHWLVCMCKSRIASYVSINHSNACITTRWKTLRNKYRAIHPCIFHACIRCTFLFRPVAARQ